MAIRCSESAVKSGPRSAPSPQKEPYPIRPRRWKTSCPFMMSSREITTWPESSLKSASGGAPV